MRTETRSSNVYCRRIVLLVLVAVLMPPMQIIAWAGQTPDGPAPFGVQQAGSSPASTPMAYYTAASFPLAAVQDIAATGWESLGRMIVAILVIIVLAGGLLWLLGDRITRPIRKLAASGRLLPGGESAETRIDSGQARDGTRNATTPHIRDLSTFGRIGRVLTSSLDLNTLLDDMANHLVEIVDATGSLIVLLDPETGQPVPMAAHGEYYDDYRSLDLRMSEPSAAWAAMSGQQPVIIRDLSNSSHTAPQLSQEHPDNSMVVLPLLVKGRVIGAALIGDNRRIRDFGQDEIEIALAVAGQFAIAIDNVRLYESTQRHLHDLSLLYQTSAAISTTLDERAVFDMAIHAFTKVFDIAECQLVVWGRDVTGRLVAERHSGHAGPSDVADIGLAGNALLEWIESNRRPLPVLPDDGELLASLTELARVGEWRSALVVPLVAKGLAIGSIILLAEDARRFSSEEISLAQTLANQIASVVQNARLYQQMEEEKRKFELAALSMGEGLVILDRDDALLFANPQAQAMLDLGDAPALGKPLATVCPQPQLLALLEQRTLSDETIFSGEMQMGSPELRDLTLSMAPVRDESGELEWCVIVIHDISELKELDRLKSEFISTVSHELRTPLASIMGFSEMIMTRQPGPLTSVQEEFMSIIYESSENLLTLVNDLLDVSRMESGRFALQIRWVDVGDLMKRTHAALAPLAQQKQIELVLDLPEDIPQIAADPRRLEQVLTNLIHNAVKFTPTEGRVSIDVRQESAGLLFSVADTGMGIPAQDMEKLFTKFYRSAQVTKAAIAGTGLGLYIAKNIVVSHGGNMGVESTENKGTTVWFTIPFVGPQQPELE